ncbi:hypothetical protein [Mucilaginibacter sp. BT774]|uniref:hypothetical protein n=1 Tax=Mucilaginibacter sp. BT774 TaxID=3062276 RepID=UPI00267762FB|nr:hypothetical protein [Mucilaginibacter sp. BT774]MDO3624594.1 hypothetical protein [Mucilaginibacter sp. BT774]
MDTLKQTISNIRLSFDDLQQDTFRKIFTHIDQLGIKQGVDKLGLERFIEQCARLSATTGVISGGGGALTMAIGIPFDLINMLTQQIRVTLGIMYYNRGTYQITFDEFVSIMAAAMQVEAGIMITKNILERGSERILLRLGSKTAARLIPVVGAVIGGTTNYLFIKRMAESVKRLQPRFQPLTVHID